MEQLTVELGERSYQIMIGFADLDHIKIAIRDGLEVNQYADGPFEFRALEDRHMEGKRVNTLN